MAAGKRGFTSEAWVLSIISVTSQLLFMQMAPPLCRAAVDHVIRFVRGTIALENATNVSELCSNAVQADPEYALKRLMPFLCDSIIELAESHPTAATGHDTVDRIDDKLQWCLKILAGVVRKMGPQLLPYRDNLTEVLDVTLPLASKDAVTLANQILDNILVSLLTPYVKESRSVPPEVWAKVSLEKLRLHDEPDSADHPSSAPFDKNTPPHFPG